MMKLEKEQFRKKKEVRGRVRWTRKHEWILISLKYMVYLSNSQILLFDKEYMLMVLKMIVWAVSISMSYFFSFDWWYWSEQILGNAFLKFFPLGFPKDSCHCKRGKKKQIPTQVARIPSIIYTRESYNYLYHNYHHHSFASIIGHIPILLLL